jgi:hypothetical protein
MALASLNASPVISFLAGVLLFAAPIALVTPVRASETNNTLPAEEESKSSSQAGATDHQARQRSRIVGAIVTPFLSSTNSISSSQAQMSAPNGLSEHALREGLGTPLRC